VKVSPGFSQWSDCPTPNAQRLLNACSSKTPPREFVALSGKRHYYYYYYYYYSLSGKRHYYSRRCAADLLALEDALGGATQTTTHVALAFEVPGVDWSLDAVEGTLAAMQLESGGRSRREGMVKFDNPFALMGSVEDFIAERSREYAA
jgi:hypothetical protein